MPRRRIAVRRLSRAGVAGVLMAGLCASAPSAGAATSLPTFVKNFSGPGRAAMYPVDVAVASGREFVLDAGRYRIVEIDRATGKIVDRVGGVQGRLPGELGAARALDVSDAGDVYVADTANNRIQVFDAALDFVRTWGAKGTGNGDFQLPYGVAVGPGRGVGGAIQDVVYVADQTGRIQRFTPDGTYLGTFPRLVDKARQLAVDPRNGHVAVVSASGKSVEVFDRDGAKLFTFGGPGSGPGEFTRDPRGIAVGPKGKFFVTDLGNYRIQVFSAKGAYLRAFGHRGNVDSAFTDPRGLAVTHDHVVVVTDLFDHALDEFSTGGTFQRERFGRPPPPRGFDVVRGLAVGAKGQLYATDWWNQRIHRISADGSREIVWGFRGTRRQPGSINFAWDVAVQPGTRRVFVADRESHEIEVFSGAGDFVTRWGSRGGGPGEFRFPQGLAFAPDGDLLVADSGNDRIQRFAIGTNGFGTFKTAWGSSGGPGSAAGLFDTPTGISVAADGTVWVADTLNSRVQRRAPGGGWTVFRTLSDGSTFQVPWGVTVAPDGTVWVADSGQDRIVVLDGAGAFDLAFAGTDVGAGDFRRPFDVAFGKGGAIWIADTWHSRIVELAAG